MASVFSLVTCHQSLLTKKRRGVRVVEGARLESVYRSKAYRGFESRPLRKKMHEEIR